MIGNGFSLPSPQRASLRWSESFLGISRTKHRQGWVLVLDKGRYLLGPADLLTPAKEASDKTILEVGGREITITEKKSQSRRWFSLLSHRGRTAFPGVRLAAKTIANAGGTGIRAAHRRPSNAEAAPRRRETLQKRRPKDVADRSLRAARCKLAWRVSDLRERWQPDRHRTDRRSPGPRGIDPAEPRPPLMGTLFTLNSIY